MLSEPTTALFNPLGCWPRRSGALTSAYGGEGTDNEVILCFLGQNVLLLFFSSSLAQSRQRHADGWLGSAGGRGVLASPGVLLQRSMAPMGAARGSPCPVLCAGRTGQTKGRTSSSDTSCPLPPVPVTTLATALGSEGEVNFV